MFERWGGWLYRGRWLVLGITLVVFAASAFYAPQLIRRLGGGGFDDPGSESSRAFVLMQRELGFSPSSTLVVYRHPEWTVDDPRFAQAAQASLERIKTLPQVRSVTSYWPGGNRRLVAPDGRLAYAQIEFNVPGNEAVGLTHQLRELARAEPLEVALTGSVAVVEGLQAGSERDLVRAELVTFPISLLILLLVFGSLIAASLPVAMGGVSVALTLALLYSLSGSTEISVFALNVTTMLGFGIGIDYSLFMVSRFREELAAGKPVAPAVTTTVATAGQAIFFSGLVVAIGLTGLLFFPIGVLRSIGLGGSLVVVCSMLAALTVVPALLGVLGPRVDSLRVPTPWRRLRAAAGRGFWARLATAVMRHPWPVIGVVVAFLLLLGAPFLGARFGLPDYRMLPRGDEARAGSEWLSQALGEGETAPVYLVVRTPGSPLAPATLGALYDYGQAVQQLPGVQRVDSLVTPDLSLAGPQYAQLLGPGPLTKEQVQRIYALPESVRPPLLRQAIQALSGERITLLLVYLKHTPASAAAQDTVAQIRALPVPPGLGPLVGGQTAALIDLNEGLLRAFPPVGLYILAVTYVALFLLFGSVLLPLKALIMNLLSVTASFGALVFIFQEGHFANLLNFEPQGYLVTTIPIVLFCLLFGLSMDYEIFLLSRIREEYRLTGDNTLSVARGLERTGRLITSAAGVLVVVALSFTLGDLVFVKSMGLGLALAIALDATIVRALLVPATMRLLGRWNWWAPEPLRRLWLRFGLEKATAHSGT